MFNSKNKFYMVFIIFSFLSGCYDIEFPASLSITGIPFSEFTASIESSTSNNNILILTVNIDNESYVLQISPWSGNINLENYEIQTIKFDTTHLPDGPSRILEFSNESTNSIILGNKTRKQTHILPEWQINAGDVIEKRTDNRFWVNVVLSNSEQSIIVEPGETIDITSSDEQWTFLLIGASVPERDVLAVVEDIIDDNTESMVAAYAGEISDEEPGLTVDWILFKNIE